MSTVSGITGGDNAEHFRLFVEQAPVAMAMFDRGMRYIAASRRWNADYGFGEAPLIGRSCYEVDPDMPELWKELHRRGLSGETLQGERDPFLPRDGPVRWLRWKIWPWREAGSSVGGIFIATENVTELAETERALSASEERLRSIVGMAPDAIIVIDEKGLIQSINPAGERMFGYASDEVIGRNVSMLMSEPDRTRHQSYIDAYCQTGVAKVIGTSRDLEHQRKDGSVFAANLTLAEWHSGGKRYFTGILRDISARKRQEEKIKLLIRELNHRSKNMLTLVQAVARQTFAAKPDDFITRFGERMQALAASQDLLVKNEWKGLLLDELVRSQLAHFTDLIPVRIELKGPPLVISASAAQTLGMALHELTTNAGKYGALSSGAGRVEIAWQLIRGPEGDEGFELSWTEEGGPEVTAPKQPGFGTVIMEDIPSTNFDAKAKLDYAREGLRWRFVCPAESVLDIVNPSPG
jgi:PAS domain S-box-containing protein